MNSQFRNRHDAGLHLTLHGISVAGVVTCLPSSKVRNLDLTGSISADDITQVVKATGVETRYVAPIETKTSDLCLKAARDLLDLLKWDPRTVDGVILMTQTPNQLLPATACRIQNQLGLSTSSFAFDVNLGCSAYPYGLWLAGSLMTSGASRILLLAGDTINHIVNPNDRSTALLFGDAGTATALERKGGDIWHFLLGTDGAGADFLQASTDKYLTMDGAKVFEFTLQRIPPLLTELDNSLSRNHDYYLFHQANRLMIEHLRRKCKISSASFLSNIKSFGNTSSASIPLLITSELSSRIGEASVRLALVGFGVGLSWAASSITLANSPLLKTTYLQSFLP
jgi:3-oxoacyl-[acyl-carrier-protein] synthase-3